MIQESLPFTKGGFFRDFFKNILKLKIFLDIVYLNNLVILIIKLMTSFSRGQPKGAAEAPSSLSPRTPFPLTPSAP